MTSKWDEAKAAISSLLKILSVDEVICVDDAYSRKVNIDDLLAPQRTLSEEELRKVFGRPEDVFSDDRDVRDESFREAWANVEQDKRKSIADQILDLARTRMADEPNDFLALHALDDILAPSPLTRVRPSEWGVKKEQLKGESETKRNLILFDQDLSDDGYGSEQGIAFAIDVLSDKGLKNRVMCGLLTHTVTPENQQDRWNELSTKYMLSQDKFIVIAKGWLGQNPVGFASMLKRVALAPDFSAMKKRAGELLDKAVNEARDNINQIYIDDFESIVCRASRKEGVWEPDMLFRLFGIFQQYSVRKLAYSDTEIRTLADKIRSVSGIPTEASITNPSNTWQVQRKEMYLGGDYINSLHLPIEVGDIFMKTGGSTNKYYMLLGQPCDLMVREGGRRTPEATDLMLAEVVRNKEKKPYSVPLPYFLEDSPNQPHDVWMRPVHFVQPFVLDLCVFNVDGSSLMKLDAVCPKNQIPVWQKRYDTLMNQARHIIRRYSEFGDKEIRDENMLRWIKGNSVDQFPFATSNSSLFKAKISIKQGNQSIAFNCKRVARLQSSRAQALYLEYSHYLTRPAFDRDLGKTD